jgi:hypothetical protein
MRNVLFRAFLWHVLLGLTLSPVLAQTPVPSRQRLLPLPLSQR